MKIKLALIIFLIISLLLSSAALGSAGSNPDTIYIHSDGSITPESAPISRNGNIYTLTSDLATQVVVGCNNIVFDGADHTILGTDLILGVGIELSCMDVVVENVHLSKWQTGIHGVYNNNTIQDCYITDCTQGIKIYAQCYVIEKNTIEGNNEAIRIGLGGLHFIAGNNFVKDNIVFSLYDSDNVIIQNNIYNCTTVFVLDNIGWNQTVYHNNFEVNSRSINDYTYSNSILRPVQSEVLPWDNGASGNYWSDYTGVDGNGDGVGDRPEQISTYYRDNALSFYTFTDRYPLISPYNTETAFPPIPSALICPQNLVVPDNNATAISFLKDVVGVDTTKYVPNIRYNDVGVDSSTISQFMQISLKDGSTEYALANAKFTNASLTSFDLGLSIFSSWPSQNSYDAAKTFMEKYRSWTGDPEVETMLNQLNNAEYAKNTTSQTGNLAFKMTVDSYQMTCKWNYNFEGVDYTGITLNVQNFTGTHTPINFQDNRATTKIGSTTLAISQSQAVNIAEQYVKTTFTYPLQFSNGTTIYINGLTPANTTATLNTATGRDGALYPCWDLHILLDHQYAASVDAVNVRVWAGNGAVFSARTESIYNTPSAILPYLGLSPLSLLAILTPIPIIALVVVLAIVLYVTRKPKSAKAVN
jgi:hypothetical protein